MRKANLLMLASAGLFTLGSCTKDTVTTPTNPVNPSGTTKNISLNVTGLQDLGSGYQYEGWLIVNGKPVTAGTFSVDASGNPSKTSFALAQTDVEGATAYVLTIEPMPDSDPAPSSVHILAGDFSSNNAALTVSHKSAIGTDFSTAKGSYILATPTDGMNNNEKSGIWWLDPNGGSPKAALELPTLPSGWKYEGWAVINGTPVSTGTFSSASGADAAATFSGSMMAPPFPGEDFLNNAPMGLTFPTDLSGGKAVISVEPVPDNSPMPFLLKPLVGDIPSGAADHTLYMENNNATATNPKGSVTR